MMMECDCFVQQKHKQEERAVIWKGVQTTQNKEGGVMRIVMSFID